jgi:hypothetical protein
MTDQKYAEKTGLRLRQKISFLARKNTANLKPIILKESPF